MAMRIKMGCDYERVIDNTQIKISQLFYNDLKDIINNRYKILDLRKK